MRKETDFSGRIESIDQSLRGVTRRLRAVEKRLSVKIPEDEIRREDREEEGLADIQSEIQKLQNRFQNIEGKLLSLEKTKNNPEILNLEAKLADLENKVTKLENVNKIKIGKIKIPIELSGILASIMLILTGYLIYANEWEIIRSTYYPLSIGIIFAFAVAAKFILTNREKIT